MATTAATTAPYLEFDRDFSLDQVQDRITVVNFWATWCAPCRHEMPMLSELQSELGGEHFEVVTIATGRNAPVAMAKFFEEIGVDNLPLHTDARMGLARAMGVLGLPASVLIDPEGHEIARMVGDADGRQCPSYAGKTGGGRRRDR